MIKLELHNNPGYPTKNPDYIGTIHHSNHGVAASINADYKSTLPVRRYHCGIEPPNFQLPATYKTSDIATAYASLNTDVHDYWQTLFDYRLI